MSDEKVIDIFQRHHRGEHFRVQLEDGESGGELVISPDNFHYVSFHYAGQEGVHKEEELEEVAEKRSYIFKMLGHHADSVRINNYHVPGEKLSKFLASLEERPGILMEIKPFVPDTTA